MLWRCPACGSQISHNPADTRPDPHDEYRCPICRIDLRFDPLMEKMQIAPFEGYSVARPEPRTIPPPPLLPRKRTPRKRRD